MKGRPRKSLAELRLMGGFRPARHADRIDEPQFDGEPVKPRGMDREAGRLWDAIVPELVARRVVRAIDTTVLVSVCELWSLYRKAIKAAASDPTSKDVRTAVIGYWRAFDAAAAHVGLSPTARTRLSVPPADDTEGIEGFSRKRTAS
ncbi:MAG: P27 family phage terminase small subunit [Planctomycetaceae bacterium]|nr:P27 family phage terminase small subunit [Planctomycetaceae bacterium]